MDSICVVISDYRKYDLFFKKSEEKGKKINDDDGIVELQKSLDILHLIPFL